MNPQDRHSDLKEALFQLLAHHQSVEGLFQESCDSPSTSLASQSIDEHISAEALSSVIQEQSRILSSPVAVVAASVLADKLKTLGHDATDGVVLSPENRQRLCLVAGVIQQLQNAGSFSRKLFFKIINKECQLPLEAVWLLHQRGIMPLNAFITSNLSRPQTIGKMSEDLLQCCRAAATEESQVVRKEIVGGIVGYLITLGYADIVRENTTSKGLQKVSLALLDSLTKKLFSGTPSEYVVNPYRESLGRDLEVDIAGVKSYCSRQLEIILSLNPVLKVSQALKQQAKWTLSKTEPWIRDTFTQLLLRFDGTEAVGLLERLLEQQEVNWRALLTYTSAVLVYYPEAPALLSKMVDEMVTVSLEGSRQDGLIGGFLLVRQACLEGPYVFQSYPDWFHTTFGAGASSLAGTKKSFSFLVSFLTDIVPFEAPGHIKAHLLRPPVVPGKCRPLWGDYVTLARTRLADLKEPIEELGIFDTTAPGDQEKMKLSVEQDVDKALMSFEKSGKVPANIMEASIFRKPYFVSRFLPALLAPRPLPDIPDARMRLIESLHSAEKIPRSLYSDYEKSCKKIAAQLLEGLFSDGDDDMDDLLLTSREQLQRSVDTLRDHIVKTHRAGTNTKGITGLLSAMGEKLDTFLGTPDTSNISLQETETIICMARPGLDKQTTQAADTILMMICQVDLALNSSADIRDVAIDDDAPVIDVSRSDWLLPVLVAVCHRQSLWRALTTRIAQLLTTQSRDLENYHIRALAGIILRLSTYPTVLATPLVETLEGTAVTPFLEFLWERLQPVTQEDMSCVLSLCVYCLEQAFSGFCATGLHYVEDKQQAVVPQHVVLMFNYLTPRLYPETRDTWRGRGETPVMVGTHPERAARDKAVRIYNSEAFRLLRDEMTPAWSVSSWIKLEIQTDGQRDALDPCQRQDYHDWMIGLFCNDAVVACSMRDAAKIIFNAILQFDSRWKGRRDGAPCCCQDNEKPLGNSRADVIQLLQRLVTLTEVAPSTTARDRPWLQDVVLERLEQCSEHDRNWDVENSFRLVRNLPLNLLHGGAASAESVLESVRGLAKIVDTHWRNHLTCGVALSWQCTAYLTHCFLSARSTFDLSLDALVTTCDSWLASVVFHWRRLQSTFSHAVRDSTSAPRWWSQCQRFHLCAESVMSDPRVADRSLLASLKDTLSTVDEGLLNHPRLLGMALFGVSQSSESVRRTLERIIHDLRDYPADGSTAEIWVCLAQCFLIQLAWQLLNQQSRDQSREQLTFELWRRLPSTFVASVELCSPAVAAPTGDRGPLFPDVCVRLLPAVCSRVLGRASVPELTTMLVTGDAVTAFLQCHMVCVRLYESWSEAEPAMTSEVPLMQPLSVKDILSLSRLIRAVIPQLSVITLENLPQDLIRQCDPDIQQSIARILRR